MTKSEVEEKLLGQYVSMPSTLELSFKSWWRSLEPSHVVVVSYPHARHGNAGKVSHSAKTTVHDDFIKFVDMNSQPNGRSADSSGPTHYFSPKFTSVQMPKTGVSHYEERKSRSIVGEFTILNRRVGRAHVPMALHIIGSKQTAQNYPSVPIKRTIVIHVVSTRMKSMLNK